MSIVKPIASERSREFVDADTINLLCNTQEYLKLSGVARDVALAILTEGGDRKRAYKKLKLTNAQKIYASKLAKSPVFNDFLEKARLLLAQKAAESGQWTFQQSLEFSKSMIQELQDHLKLAKEIENNSTRIQRTVDITKAVQFWKENLDRMHGFLQDTVKNLNVSANLKELADIQSERDLIDLANNLDLLAKEAEMELQRTAPQRMPVGGEDSAAP